MNKHYTAPAIECEQGMMPEALCVTSFIKGQSTQQVEIIEEPSEEEYTAPSSFWGDAFS